MSNLLVGHVTPDSARVWVRGDKKSKAARLRYRLAGTAAWKTESALLEENRGYVAVIDVQGLDADSTYECDLSYQGEGAPTVKAGRFKTPPAADRDTSFLLASCNWTRAPLDILDPEVSWEGIETLVGAHAPDFMIHCGDQVYSDVLTSPLPQFMDVRYYRQLYQKAWKIKPCARVLASLPHYMILDDHEIFDDYYNGKTYVGQSSQAIRGAALTAYREYQHSHNPRQFPTPALYDAFGYGGAQFFLLDTRSERFSGPNNQIIGEQQMSAFKQWLQDNAGAVKFAVTSVPLVAETRNPDDKWSGEDNRRQRDEIIDFLAQNADIGRLVFLTGDMHCSYHATMTIQRAGGELVVHELMSSPINQFTNGIDSFVESVDTTTLAGTPYAVELKDSEFYGKHSNVMLIRARANGQIAWEVWRTKDTSAAVLQGEFAV
jgi:phosphodiesterase/alkaline phosphatase D-like protein